MSIADQQFIPGQVPVLIEHKFALTVEDLSVTRRQQSAIASGFAGNYARRDGIAQYEFNFSMPPLASGFEFDPAILTQPFTLTYRLGNVEYNLVAAKCNSDDLAVAMQSGNTTTKWSGNALSRTPF